MSYSKQETVADFDPELWKAISCEAKRQDDHIELIASETVSYTHLTLPTKRIV